LVLKKVMLTNNKPKTFSHVFLKVQGKMGSCTYSEWCSIQ
jgi:hypothetical protein